LFVIAQVLFLFLYNILDIAGSEEGRDYLVNQRKLWNTYQKGDPIPPGPDGKSQDHGKLWGLIVRTPLVGEVFEEWVEKADGSRLEKLRERSEWWARKSGQEQGWSLFAPNTWRFTCLVRVEARWDDDIVEVTPHTENVSVVALTGGPGAKLLNAPADNIPTSRFILGLNEPRDINRYVRIGGFRWRRYESKFETTFEKDESEGDWERSASRRVYGTEKRGSEKEEIIRYLRWKFDRFREENPDLRRPKQMVLWSATWSIPDPPGPTPWAWQEEAMQPIVRWRTYLDPRSDNLELYLHTEHRFQNKIVQPWLNRMPGSSD
jgi:hypothetical protein